MTACATAAWASGARGGRLDATSTTDESFCQFRANAFNQRNKDEYVPLSRNLLDHPSLLEHELWRMFA